MVLLALCLWTLGWLYAACKVILTGGEIEFAFVVWLVLMVWACAQVRMSRQDMRTAAWWLSRNHHRGHW